MTARSSFYGTKQRTVTDRKTAMTLFLYGCRDSALAAITVDELGRRYGLDPKVCEYELTICRQNRGVVA